MKIKIDVPVNCLKCPCYAVAYRCENDNRYEYHLCKAFNRILTTMVNGFGTVQSIKRCQECIDSEVNVNEYKTKEE